MLKNDAISYDLVLQLEFVNSELAEQSIHE